MFVVKWLKKCGTTVLAIFLLTAVISEIIIRYDSNTAFAAKGEKPIYCVDTQEKKLAISFDAAWGADNTVKLMDICDSYGVKATFFLVGFWVDKYPDMVKEIDRRGFEIGNHSVNHPQMTKLLEAQMVSEINGVNESIYALIGKTPRLFRPPFGDYNDTVVKTLKSNGMLAIQWSVDSLDWKEYGRTQLCERVLKNIKNGDIVLFHNNAKYTPEALPYILEQIQAKGYSICTVGELVYDENYYVDSCGIQHIMQI